MRLGNLSSICCVGKGGNGHQMKKKEEDDILKNEEEDEENSTSNRKREWEEARLKHETCQQHKSYPILTLGSTDTFHSGGLTLILGKPQKLLYEAMEKEHVASQDSNDYFDSPNYQIRTTSKIEWNFVLDPSQENLEKLNLKEWPKENKKFEKHQRVPRTLDSFEEVLKEKNELLARVGMPALTMIELIAYRLHTGALGPKYNRILRFYGSRQDNHDSDDEAPYKGNKYTTTLHVLQSAVAKLGKINPSRKGYCGIDGLLLPDCAWRNDPILNTKGGVQYGLMGMSKKLDVAIHFANRSKSDVGIILEIDMGSMDRGAEAAWISQYPDEEETLLPPLTYLHVEHIKHVYSSSHKIFWIVEVRSRLSPSITIERPILAEQEMDMVRMTIKKSEENEYLRDKSDQLSRFTGKENNLITGNPMKSVLGLPYFLNIDVHELNEARSAGIEAMRKEIEKCGNEEVIENMKYVFDEKATRAVFPNGIRDGENIGKSLQDFHSHPIASKCGLTIEHVAALRLYTTSAYKFINNPLRNPGSDQNQGDSSIAHPYPVTVSYIDEAIKQLRATASSLESYPVLWRGFKNTRIEEEFLQDRKGGCELGLMSTTHSLSIATMYSKSVEGNALLFKIKVDNMKQLGADISWLSAFPQEEEILYPPLTYLQPTGKVETTTIDNLLFTIVEVQPHI